MDTRREDSCMTVKHSIHFFTVLYHCYTSTDQSVVSLQTYQLANHVWRHKTQGYTKHSWSSIHTANRPMKLLVTKDLSN